VSAGRSLRASQSRLAAIAVAASLSVLAAACSGAGPAGPGAGPSRRAPGAASRAAGPAAPPSLAISPAPYQLPAGLSREVVLAHGPDLLIAGGLTPQSTSSIAVRLLDPVTGSTVPAGRLAAPTHDAAGATLGGRDYIFGGGDQASVATVQALAGNRPATVAGRLPGPRSDLTAVTVGGTAYLLGGYDGSRYDASVLATTDGRHFRTVARLPVPVRYPAVAALGRQIWVFGGQTPAGLTSDIQRISLPAAGAARAAVAGHLPRPSAAGTAFSLGGALYVAGGLVTGPPPAGQATAPAAGAVTTGLVLRYRPGQRTATAAGMLPVPVSNAAVTVLSGTALVIGGDDGTHAVPSVTRLRLVPAAAAAGRAAPAAGAPDAAANGPLAGGPASSAAGAAGTGPAGLTGPVLASEPWLGPARGPGHLAPHSDPAALPGDVLIADHRNNRLLIVDPQGRVRWQFPAPGDLARGQTFLVPDDAFFSPDGRDIVATEEDDSVISIINIATHRITYRYGTPGVPGSTANHLSNPDDAMLLPGGALLTADIKNCRIVLVRPPAHQPLRVIGQTTGGCWHNPPHRFGSPNGAFPMTSGQYLVTEINGDWVNAMSLSGHVAWSANPPGVAYPSDTNEVYPGRYLTADYSTPGQVVEFTATGRLLWRFGGLNHPSLALPLPNGDILVNDDYNDRVIVIDPVTSRIVWQYGRTGRPGTAPGFLNDPDGVDLAPPDSLMMVHAATTGLP